MKQRHERPLTADRNDSSFEPALRADPGHKVSGNPYFSRNVSSTFMPKCRPPPMG